MLHIWGQGYLIKSGKLPWINQRKISIADYLYQKVVSQFDAGTVFSANGTGLIE